MSRRLAALTASFIGDALALGPHWIYNQSKIARLYPDGITGYDDPRADYHRNRRAGQFTHYGDQTLALLRSVAFRKGWNPDGFRNDWHALWTDYDGFVDKATTQTLENAARGAPGPSDSNDLAGAARLGPLVVALRNAPLEKKIEAARAQTTLTHGDPSVADAAEFFMRASEHALAGRSIPDALSEAAREGRYPDLAAADALDRARAAVGGDPMAAASEFGLTCHTPEAFPATLFMALQFAADLPGALAANSMAGGDSAARGMLLGLLLGAAHGFEAIPYHWIEDLAARREIEALLTLLDLPGEPGSQKVSFPSASGQNLDARLELPAGPVRAVALFAHCFTCGKDSRAAVRISRALAADGFATLRFDFTGLGSSEGDFANTSFITNVDDLLAAASHLRRHYRAPALLVGHSLGGAAVLAAAGRLPECRAVATIGAPADPEHVTRLFGDDVNRIETEGVANVTLAGRSFRLGKRFLDDLRDHCQPCEIARLDRDLLIMHAPGDEIVGINNAAEIYRAARHPKSFVSLADADHLLTKQGTSEFTARILAAWASRSTAESMA